MKKKIYSKKSLSASESLKAEIEYLKTLSPKEKILSALSLREKFSFITPVPIEKISYRNYPTPPSPEKNRKVNE